MESIAHRPYHYWKFREALSSLATTDAPLRKRLEWAMLNCIAVRDDDLPEPVKATWLELRAQLTWRQDGDPREGTIVSTLAVLSDDDLKRAAEQFIKLFDQTVDPSAEHFGMD